MLKLKRFEPPSLEATAARMLASAEAGAPLPSVIRDAARMEHDKRVKTELETVLRRAELGLPLKECVERVEARGLKELLTGMREAAETGGGLAEWLRFKLEELLRLKRERLRRAVLSLTLLSEAYIALAVVMPLTLFIVVTLLSGLGSPLPLSPVDQLNLLVLVGVPVLTTIALLALNAALSGVQPVKPKTSLTQRLSWTGLTLPAATLAFYAYSGSYNPAQSLLPLNPEVTMTLALTVLAGLTPASVVYHLEARRATQVSKEVPGLLRSALDAVKGGAPTLQALEAASTPPKDPLRKELKRSVNAFKLGLSLEASFKALASRLKHPEAEALSLTLLNACRSGDRGGRVLEAASHAYTSLEEFRRTRILETRPYLAVAYAATLIFLAVSLTTLLLLVKPLTLTGLGAVLKMPSLNALTSLALWACLAESLSAGLYAGLTSSGSAASGLKHGLLMGAVSLAAFKLFAF